MTTTLVPITLPNVDGLTADDLENLAFTYGGTVERNVRTNTVRLVGAVFAGRRVTLGPVRSA